MFKRFFCWAYEKWLSGVLNDKQDPLVRFLDILESKCKYCQMVRIIMATAGITLALCGHWIALILPLIAWLLTLGERLWLCELK